MTNEASAAATAAAVAAALYNHHSDDQNSAFQNFILSLPPEQKIQFLSNLAGGNNGGTMINHSVNC